jgi:acyl transferase domain-containing protein
MLQQGKCRRGIITAALLTLDPSTLVMLTAAGMLAPDGRCKTLDASADGCDTRE